MIDPARVADAAEQLRSRLLPPPIELEALLATVELAMGPYRRARSLRQRDQLYREIANKFYAGKCRPKAEAISKDLAAYGGNGYLRDVASTSPPPSLAGTAQQHFWNLLKTWPDAPRGWRRIYDIIKP